LTIASSNYADAVSFVGLNYSFRPYFKAAVAGRSATFFAVGATTGIPGYFIAEPVWRSQQVLGVVVAKVDLEVLVSSWSELAYDSIVTDEHGVVILSTRPDLLYTPTRELTQIQQRQLLRERRYELKSAVLNDVFADRAETLIDQVKAIENSSLSERATVTDNRTTKFVLSSQALGTEPWQLASLISVAYLRRQAFNLSMAICAGLIITYLLFRLYQQQRHLVHMQRRNSRELEAQVLQRTRELASAQERVVSESNFAMLGRMSAAINHEINQPLASLRLNLASLRQLIQKSETDKEAIEQIVVDSDRTTKRIGRVISSLRSVAKKNDEGFDTVSMTRLVDDVVETIRRERPVMHQTLRVNDTAREKQVVGNEILIQQALLNLIYNAFDAVLEVDDPRVVIETKVDEIQRGKKDAAPRADGRPMICISVLDNGKGVDDCVAGSLFEPFSTHTTRNDGLGLGLTIARQIAVDHGGDLTYRHGFEPDQPGSCFTLHLPLEDSSLDYRYRDD
jgi:two-component system C4-dicarboxylate transport sensor histidine kinase DctB